MYSYAKTFFLGVCPWNGNFEGARKVGFFPSYRLCPVLIMLITRKITGKLSVQSLRVYIRQVIIPQVKPFKGYTWKKFKVGRGC